MEFLTAPDLVDYPAAVAAMEAHVADMIAGRAGPRVWFLEHPPTYTAGTSAKDQDLKTSPLAGEVDQTSVNLADRVGGMQAFPPPDTSRVARFVDLPRKGGGLGVRIPVYLTGRGGQYTYHGPGQRVAYVMLDLRAQYGLPDLRRYVHDLEQWVINALADLGVSGTRVPGRVGIWVDNGQGGQDKIAALGVRVRRGVAFHGVAINVDPDLTHYAGIVPCGISDAGVTSLKRLGNPTSLQVLDEVLKRHFIAIFDKDSNFVASQPQSMMS